MWTYAALAVFSAGFVAYAGWRRVPATTLAAAGEGTRARVTGAIAAPGELTSGPFSGTPCVVALGERWELSSRGDPMHCIERQPLVGSSAEPVVVSDAL